MREKIIGKNELDRNYILFGKKNSELIDQNRPITLICNGKVYSDKVFNKQRYIIYANKEFYEEQMIELGDNIIFDIDGISNIVRITVLKQQRKSETNETNDIDKTKTMDNNESKPSSDNLNVSKEEFLKLIEELRNTFKENEWCFRASEENVRAELIDPILSALGWKIPFLRREDHGKDYLLCSEKYVNKESMKVIIEAKKYKEQLLSQLSNNDNKNKSQLLRYCKAADTHVYGVLTNGRKWIKFEFQKSYTDLNYVSEIDLLKDDNNALYNFFWSISFSEIKNGLCKIAEIQPHNSVESCPTNIIIDEQSFGKQREANYHVAKKFLNYCVANNMNPFDFSFMNNIVSEKPLTNSYGEERTCEEYKINGKKYYLIGDYGIYVKTALLKEINSTLDLGLSITVE